MFDGSRCVLPAHADVDADTPTSCCDVYAKTASTGDCYDHNATLSPQSTQQRSTGGGDYTVIRKTGDYGPSPTTPPLPPPQPPPGQDTDTTTVHWPTVTGARDVINRPPASTSSSPSNQQQHDDVTTTLPALQCNHSSFCLNYLPVPLMLSGVLPGVFSLCALAELMHHRKYCHFCE